MPNLDICITLRCNAHCQNCIEFCNMQDVTGLDYSDSDMTISQINNFINQVRATRQREFFGHVYVTGGEPLLHPQVELIVQMLESLVQEGYISNLHVNSNLIIPPPPSLKKYTVNFSLPKDNPKLHSVVLMHPSKISTGNPKTRAECKHYRKDTWVLNYQGFHLCCAGDAYIRLYGLQDLILDHLPRSDREFPAMDQVCRNCPFGVADMLPKERVKGRPVSGIYSIEAGKNRRWRKLTKRYPGNDELIPSFIKQDPLVYWVCCTYNRPKQLGNLIYCFLQQDYPKEKRRLLILDDAGQYNNQKGDGWELISLPKRFTSLGQKRNAAIALLPEETDIICTVDDDDLYLPHAMKTCVEALQKGDWVKPSYVYEEHRPGVLTRERYHGHSASWAFWKWVYYQTSGYTFINVGEDGGLQTQLESLNLSVVDPIQQGAEPYYLCTRFREYHAHTFKNDDYKRLQRKSKNICQIEITPGYKNGANGEYILIPTSPLLKKN